MPLAKQRESIPSVVEKVLLVDDDAPSRDSLKRLLEEAGIACVSIPCFEDAVEFLRTQLPGFFDAVLVATDAPPSILTAFLGAVRSPGNEDPVIVISGQDTPENRIRSFELGADDFVARPFDPRELLMRLESIVRRNRALPKLRAIDICMDLARRTVHRGDRRLWLSQKEFDLLQMLVESRGRILGRAWLFQELWGFEFDPKTSALSVLVTRLRKKLDGPGSSLIQAIPNRGYRLVTPAPFAQPEVDSRREGCRDELRALRS